MLVGDAPQTPQKYNRIARLERFALLIISSPQHHAFLCHRQRRNASPPNTSLISSMSRRIKDA